MAFIRAFTLSRMLEIKTGVNSPSLLCLWKMVVLVGILMLNRLPLIGGEPGVQIPILIWTRLTLRSVGPVYPVNAKKLTFTVHSCDCTKYTLVSKCCYRENDAPGITWFEPCTTPNQNQKRAYSLVIVTFTVQAVKSYLAFNTGATPSDSNVRPIRGHSSLVAEPVTSKRDCNHWHPRGGVRKVWENTIRHVVSRSNLRGRVIPRVRNKVGYGAFQYRFAGPDQVYSRYMGSEQSVTCRMFCEMYSLWMSFRAQPVEKGATYSNEADGAKIYQCPSRVEGSHYPTPMPKGGWCYKACCIKLIAVSPFGLSGKNISYAVQGGDTCVSASRAEDSATREGSFPSASRSYELATQQKTSASSRAKDLAHQENYPSGPSGDYGLAPQRFGSVQPTSIQFTNDPSGVRSERQNTTSTSHSESDPGRSAYNPTTTLNERCASVVMYTSIENWRIDGTSILLLLIPTNINQ